jgi:hypothetical protein
MASAADDHAPHESCCSGTATFSVFFRKAVLAYLAFLTIGLRRERFLLRRARYALRMRRELPQLAIAYRYANVDHDCPY